jgi:hypothetical protein
MLRQHLALAARKTTDASHDYIRPFPDLDTRNSVQIQCTD